MIDCESVREELSAYIDNELPSSQRQKIEQHLQLCKRCYDEYFELQATSAIMRSLKEIEPPPGLKEKVKERLFKEEKQGIWQKIVRRPWHSLGAAVAGLLLLIGSWNLLFDGGLAKIHSEIAEQEAAQIQYVAEELAEKDNSIGGELLQNRVKQTEEADNQAMDMAASPSDTVMMAAPDASAAAEETYETANQTAKEEPQTYEVAVRPLPAEPEEQEAQEESVPEKPISRAMALQADVPLNEKGLEIEVSIKTENSVLGQEAIESIANRYGLEIISTKENGLITMELLSPINMQKSIMEQLREIGFVANEVVSNPELDKKISDLTTSQEELLQQQSELKALIASGGTAEEVEVWQKELAKVQALIEEVQAELSGLDQALSPSLIKITLIE